MGGPYAEDSGRGSVAAARFAIEDFQRTQPGFMVELVSADSQTKPDVAAAIAGAWYDRDGVDMIIDVPVSNCALAVASVTRSRNKVAIFNTARPTLREGRVRPIMCLGHSTPTRCRRPRRGPCSRMAAAHGS